MCQYKILINWLIMKRKYYTLSVVIIFVLLVLYYIGTREICYQVCADVCGERECVNQCTPLYKIVSRTCTITPAEGKVSDEAALGALIRAHGLSAIKKLFR